METVNIRLWVNDICSL